jgi:hypothetical protein
MIKIFLNRKYRILNLWMVTDTRMINTIEQFGRNAGIVWDLLSEEGPLPIDEIADKTHLRMYETEIAIGWLARENKVSYDNGKYSLAPTNLTTSIGSNAGDLWHLLHQQGKASIHHISKESTLPTQEIYKAVGWLAREEKINIELE